MHTQSRVLCECELLSEHPNPASRIGACFGLLVTCCLVLADMTSCDPCSESRCTFRRTGSMRTTTRTRSSATTTGR
eukprot:1392654-Rhodomonas_salina.1